MASGAGKGNFGSKFRNFIGGKKKQKPKYGSTGSIGSGESDEEGYMDPEGLFATEPPGPSKPPIPDYPPPSCPGSKYSPKMPRPYSSIDPSSNLNSNEMRDYARSLDSSQRKPKPTIPDKPKTVPRQMGDDYSDPWDSRDKMSGAVPQKAVSAQRLPADNYMDPYDSKGSQKPAPGHRPQTMPPSGRENYIEPWDTRSKPRDMKPKHRDDYKDPWDTQMPESLPKSSFEEDDDYTVPYDAGKPTPTLTSNGKNPPLAEMDDLYDLPYEEQMALARAKVKAESERPNINGSGHTQMPANTGRPPNDDYDEPWEQKAKLFQALQTPPHQPQQPTQQPPKHVHDHSRQQPHHHVAQQQQPQRPPQGGPDDYDAPWEWNNKSLTKAFANLPPPTASQAAKTRERVDSSMTSQSRPAKHAHQTVQSQSSVEQLPPSSPRHYEVDPTMPIQNQGWYHGKISRFEAEALLKNLPDCSYLIRDSESSRSDYSLSLRNNSESMHLKISCRDGRFILGQHSKPYDSIPEMIHHYSMNKLNIRGAEQVKLMYPVLQEAMYFTVEPGT